MCKMKDDAMSRTGELPGVPVRTAHDATAAKSVTQLMADLARTIDASGSTLMISQAASVLNALGTLPVADTGVQAELLRAAHAELADKDEQIKRLAAMAGGQVVASIKEDPKFYELTERLLGGEVCPARIELAALIDSRPTATKVIRNTKLDGVAGVERDAVLEEAAAACDALESDLFDQYKGRGKHEPFNPARADPVINGQSDGAGQCSAAIRALKSLP